MASLRNMLNGLQAIVVQSMCTVASMENDSAIETKKIIDEAMESAMLSQKLLEDLHVAAKRSYGIIKKKNIAADTVR